MRALPIQKEGMSLGDGTIPPLVSGKRNFTGGLHKNSVADDIAEINEKIKRVERMHRSIQDSLYAMSETMNKISENIG